MNLHEVRAALAGSLSELNAVVYAYPPSTVLAPSVTIVPDYPYLSPINLGKDKFKVSFRVTAAVNFQDNQSALDNLETLLFAIYANLPSNIMVGDASQPAITDLGQSQLLSSEVTVSLITQAS